MSTATLRWNKTSNASMRLLAAAACLASLLFTTTAWGDGARFDLTGPRLDVRVTRGGVTLPIAEVPNLLPGDKLWVKADLPADQSNHLLLIVAFLRGTTNEPPDNWFTEIDTWEKKKTVEGTTVTVPASAEQALLFVAPETGGDFKTLRSAVKGRPGTFIRADADLNEASFEQQRIERYLAAMRQVSSVDAKAIQDQSAKLASTLALKPNAECFKQPVEAQVSCLTQSSAPMLLDDGHGQGIANALSTGATSDFINAASYTSAAGGGLYSAYVGAVVDLVHLVSTLHTAKYQYIPGLSFPEGDTLNLKLNAPVSFHDPKSVIVIGLPAIKKAEPPPLHAHDPNQLACLLQPKLALPLEGAPLVFSTSFAHDLVLHLNRAGAAQDLPLEADASQGGLVVVKDSARKPLRDANPPSKEEASAAKEGSRTDLTITGTVRGMWGFDSFQGPTLSLQQIDGTHFRITGDSQVIAGEAGHLLLAGDGTACVQKVLLEDSQKTALAFTRLSPQDKQTKATAELRVEIPAKDVKPGTYQLAVQQYGTDAPAKVAVTAFNGDVHFTALQAHAGDNTAVLRGEGLGSVQQVKLGDQVLKPEANSALDQGLLLAATENISAPNGTEAHVLLTDGRNLPVVLQLEAARPALTLLSTHVTPAPIPPGGVTVALDGKGEIPLDGTLGFVVGTKGPFPRDAQIEIATSDGALHTHLSVAGNSLVLQDQHTAIGTLDPLKAFGRSAFGKLQMRAVSADGTQGPWVSLGTLVRTPQITGVQCTTATSTCVVNGNELFLAQSFAPSAAFAHVTDVPSGYGENTITVPLPADGKTLYLKLRDAPDALATLSLTQPVTSSAPPTTAAASTVNPATPNPASASPQ